MDFPTNTTASVKKLELQLVNEKEYPWLNVSPVREQEFIETLKAINPDIEINVSDKKGIWRILGWDI